MQKQPLENAIILEEGNIYFFYRPKVNLKEVASLKDVQRLYMVLQPYSRKKIRMIMIPKKKLPVMSKGKRAIWGFVDKTGSDLDILHRELDAERYTTKTKGERNQGAARAAGEGVYAIAWHEDHTHLVYILELPEKPNEVQKALHITNEGSLIISVKNPKIDSPENLGLPEKQQAEYPKRLQQQFGSRKFINLNPPDYLDYEGTELMLMEADDDIAKELGITLNTEDETEASAEIFKELKLERNTIPKKPLFEGKWA